MAGAFTESTVKLPAVKDKIGEGVVGGPVPDALHGGDGSLLGRTRMAHIADCDGFRDKDYYDPGDTGAPVYDPRAGRLGVAICYDRHYPEYMRALALAGAELVMINTLTDSSLPAIDGLFIGGGFPETQMQALAANTAMRQQIREAIGNGLPAYAECGGLMYLCRSLRWQDKQYEMAGVIPADCVMHPRPQGRGYVRLRETAAMPWAGPRPGASLSRFPTRSQTWPRTPSASRASRPTPRPAWSRRAAG